MNRVAGEHALEKVSGDAEGTERVREERLPQSDLADGVLRR